MCDEEYGVQSSCDIANGDQILLSKGGPEENICCSKEQMSAQTNNVPEVTISSGGAAKQENTDEDSKAMGFEASNRMRRALSRGKWPDTEEVADSFGDHCDAPGKEEKHPVETQRPRAQWLIWSHDIFSSATLRWSGSPEHVRLSEGLDAIVPSHESDTDCQKQAQW